MTNLTSSQVLERYGVKIQPRPKIEPVKQLDLSDWSGEQIIKSETQLALVTHKKTFKKLADM
ncbi:MAG: hypothetical protein ACRC4K_06965 [Plesiomonas shigelloides]